MTQKKLLTKTIVFFLLLQLLSLHAAYQEEKNNPNELAKEIALGNTLFAFELQQKLGLSEKNLIFSPFSLSSALAMLSAGAKGETYEQMRKVLHLPETGAEADLGFRSLFTKLQPKEHETSPPFISSQSIWIDTSLQILPLFQSRIVNNFLGTIQQAPFSKEPQAARLKINQWVAKKTNHHILDLFPSGSIDSLTRLVLANAIYLKAPFTYPFDPQLTQEKPFFVSDKESRPLPFMQQKHTFPYLETASFQAVELPYNLDSLEFALWILLPKEKLSMQETVEKFTLSTFEEIKQGLKPQKLQLSLPKFRVEFVASLEKPLKELGMTLPFSEEANFSLMAKDPSLSLSSVQHKAIMEVTEAGTEAAAATGAVLSVKSALPEENFTNVTVNHPFLFLLLDKQNDLVLFMGHVIDPQRI